MTPDRSTASMSMRLFLPHAAYALACLLPAFASAQQQHHAHATHGAPSTQTAPAPADAASPPPRSPALPAPTAEERTAAFPDLGDMDMRGHMDDNPFIATLRFDRLEWQSPPNASAGGGGLAWELQGWAGGLDRRVWLRSEGERRDGGTEAGDLELFWARPTGPWWDLLVGVRHDIGEGPSRDWIAIGVQGIAPYKFEVAATAYVGASGRTAARFEAEYDVLLTNRWILQPRIEANAYGKGDPERGIGDGAGDAGIGLRLRYEFSRQFAPYIGHAWTRRFGDFDRSVDRRGEDRSEAIWVAGVRFWF